MKITYNTIQLDRAVDFLIANNPVAAAMGENAVKRLILDYMVEIAHMNKYSTISTLGFMVAGGGTFTPAQQQTQSYTFHVFVDPCLKSQYYNFIDVEI